MATDESLLDVFVVVGIKETGENVEQYVERVKKVFGGIGSSGPGDELAKGIKKSLDKSVNDAKEAAGKIVAGLREALLRFGLDKDALSIRIRLLGDADIQRRLQDIQSQVSAAQKEFQLAEPGEIGNADRAASIEKINSLRQSELVALEAITNEMITQRGLDSVADKATAAFLTAAQQAQNFSQKLKEVNQQVNKSGNIGLKDEFAVLNTEAQRFLLILRQAQASGDPIRADDAVASLNTLEQKLDPLLARASRGIVIKTNAAQIAEDFDKAFRAFQRQDAFDAGVTRGNALSGEQKVALLTLKKQVGDIRDEFVRLASAVDLTADQIARMRELAVNLDAVALSVSGIRKQAQVGGQAVNGLSNNAYQLGQAFEDAAVGYQLNGIAGAARGASNNVAFLINNLAQAGSFNNLVGESAAKLIPLYAGIGSVVAILILPVLAEWIDAMDDIELTSKGVAETIKREFSDAKFLVSLELDNRSALKAVQDAENAKEAIAIVIRQSEEAKELRFKIIAELDSVSQRNVFDKMSKAMDDLQKSVDDRLIDLNRDPLVRGEDFGPITVLPGEDFEELKKVEKIAKALKRVREESQKAFDQVGEDIVPLNALVSSRDAARLLNNEYKELAKSGVLTKENAEELKTNIEAILNPLESYTEQVEKLRSKEDQLLDSTLKQLGLFSELSAESRFLNEVNEGRLEKEHKILFDLREQNAELEKQHEAAREAIGDGNPLLEAGLAKDAAKQNEEQRIRLISEINDLEKDIADRRADSAKDEEAAAKRRLDIEGKIADEQIQGQAEVDAADAALQSEKDKQALDARQKAIQDRIDALQRLDKTSTNFAAGSLGTQAFGDDVKPEVERLQEELKALRETEAKKAAADRIKDLEDRIISEREEAQNRLQGLRDDLADARQAEIDAVNKNAEETQKLIEQLRKFQEALLNNKLGLDPLADQAERDKLFFNEPDRMGFLPEDDIQGMGNAQANANAAAMEGVDFKSSSLETLTEQTNRLLFALNDGVSRLDMQTRLA